MLCIFSGYIYVYIVIHHGRDVWKWLYISFCCISTVMGTSLTQFLTLMELWLPSISRFQNSLHAHNNSQAWWCQPLFIALFRIKYNYKCYVFNAVHITCSLVIWALEFFIIFIHLRCSCVETPREICIFKVSNLLRSIWIAYWDLIVI